MPVPMPVKATATQSLSPPRLTEMTAAVDLSDFSTGYSPSTTNENLRSIAREQVQDTFTLNRNAQDPRHETAEDDSAENALYSYVTSLKVNYECNLICLSRHLND